ncbi:MAG TPA: isoprenylcysteine carboxylmethyltransferase family protein, partial [Verrucomicrobiae bacterium]|nr:isoprenylcysteine carboxylmethyltransferase family protein [Verrucomicrobiae bacterium]
RSGVRMVPPLLYLLTFAAGLLLQRYAPAALSDPGSQWIGGLLLLVSAGLGGWSLFRVLRERTSPLPIQPSTTLVITGPYRFIRNPMYVSLILLYLGLALSLRMPWPILFLPIAQAVVRYHVVAGEEKYLERKFGAAYVDYKARVPRWLPRIFRRK